MKLEAIRAITWSVPDPAVSLRAFTATLGLEPVAEGRLSARQAEAWSTPALAGARFAAVTSPDRPRVLLRFVEAAPDAAAAEDPSRGGIPLVTTGWNAAELHVRDVAGLANRLEGGPFEILGPPRDLLGNGAVRAMQVQGPGRELLYLTEITQAGMQRTYGRAEAPVGRPFIVVLGARDHTRSLGHYEPLARFTTDPRPFRVTVLARAHGLDPETSEFTIASAVLQQRFRIEIDAYPKAATRRQWADGALPPGLGLVTVSVSGGAQGEQPMILEGPDGEWLECLPAGGERERILLREGQLS